jgi:hypothetical protein
MLGAATPCNTKNRAYGPYAGGARLRNILAGPVPWRDVAFDIRRAVEPYNSLMR